MLYCRQTQYSTDGCCSEYSIGHAGLSYDCAVMNEMQMQFRCTQLPGQLSYMSCPYAPPGQTLSVQCRPEGGRNKGFCNYNWNTVHSTTHLQGQAQTRSVGRPVAKQSHTKSTSRSIVNKSILGSTINFLTGCSTSAGQRRSDDLEALEDASDPCDKFDGTNTDLSETGAEQSILEKECCGPQTETTACLDSRRGRANR